MEKDCCEDCLEDLKKDYSKIQGKHKLPDFDSLNKDFSIERITETQTELLIREIRKLMSEKYSNYLRFIETILHPTNSGIFVFSFIKTLGVEEKNKLAEMYGILAKLEISLIELDIDFNEEKEADFIKESYSSWQSIKKDLLKIIGVVKKNWENKTESSKTNYFG